MSDLISRQAILKNIEKIRQSAQMMDDTHRADIIMQGMYLCEKAVRNQPPAQQWIPCSERLPEDDTLMLVNYIDERPDAGDIWIGWHEMENVWYIDGEEHSREYGGEVIAWMPLPEPYKGGDDE